MKKVVSLNEWFENKSILEEGKDFRQMAIDILQDLSQEFDPWEIRDMLPKDAEDTVDGYYPKMSSSDKKKLAKEILNMASEPNEWTNESRVNEGKGHDEARKLVDHLRSKVFKRLNDDELDEFKKEIALALDLNESTHTVSEVFKYTEDDINMQYGFYGTLDNHYDNENKVQKMYLTAIKDLMKSYRVSEETAIKILDSREGRHFADFMIDGMVKNVVDAMAKFFGSGARVFNFINQIGEGIEYNEDVVTEATSNTWGTYSTPDGATVAKAIDKAYTKLSNDINKSFDAFKNAVKDYSTGSKKELGNKSGFNDTEGEAAITFAIKELLAKTFNINTNNIYYDSFWMFESLVNEAITYKVFGKEVTLNKGEKSDGTDWSVTFKNGKTVPLSDVLASIKPLPDGITKESINVNEARSINRIQKDFTRVTSEMAEVVLNWKAAKQAGDSKAEANFLARLKDLTAEKKGLEKEMNDFVLGKDKDLELAVGAE